MKREFRAERERQVQVDIQADGQTLAELTGVDPALLEPADRAQDFRTQQLLQLEALHRFLQAVAAALAEQAKPAPKRKAA